MASPYHTPTSISEIETALDYIDNHDRMRWLKIGAALKSELGEDGFSIWDKWSQSAKNYNKGVMNSQWKSLIPGKFNIGTLFYEAMQKGYQPTKEATPLSSQEIAERRAAAIAARQEAEAIRKEEQRVASLQAQKEYEALSPVRSLNHDYLVAKLIDDPKLLNRVRRDGDDLVIPLKKHGEITGLQKINGTGWKSFTKGMELKGSSFVMGPWGNCEKGLVLTEGYATAASIHKATGLTTIVCFAGFNIKSVAESLPKDLGGPIYIAADYDLPSQSGKRAGLEYALAAKAVLSEKATVIEPYFSEDDFKEFETLYGHRPSDFNDLHKLHGLEAVNDQFSQKIKEIEMKQSIVSVHLPENEVSLHQYHDNNKVYLEERSSNQSRIVEADIGEDSWFTPALEEKIKSLINESPLNYSEVTKSILFKEFHITPGLSENQKIAALNTMPHSHFQEEVAHKQYDAIQRNTEYDAEDMEYDFGKLFVDKKYDGRHEVEVYKTNDVYYVKESTINVPEKLRLFPPQVHIFKDQESVKDYLHNSEFIKTYLADDQDRFVNNLIEQMDRELSSTRGETQAEAILEENSISPDRFRIEELREERGDDYVEKSEFTTHTVNEQNIEDDNIKQPTDQAAEQTIKSPSADLEEESGKERIDVEKELRRPVILNHDYDHPPGELKAKFVFTESGEYIDKDGYYHFADKGDNLKTNKRDLDTVRAMLEVANAKNWEAIQLKGNKEFKRLAYIEASIQGIEARGYTPTERDLAIIKQEREVRGFNTIKEAHTILKSSQETTTRQMPEGATTEREENTSPTPPPQSTDKTSPVKDGATTDEIENEASKRSLAREEAEKDKVANQNRAPDRAVVEDSERVDEKGAEVPMAGIGGNEIRSELRAFMNSFTTKQQGLNADSMAMLRLMKRMVQPMVSNLNKEHRDQAIRNFNEKIDQSITGDRLNIDFPGDRSRPTAEHETPRENSFRDYQPVERTR